MPAFSELIFAEIVRNKVSKKEQLDLEADQRFKYVIFKFRIFKYGRLKFRILRFGIFQLRIFKYGILKLLILIIISKFFNI